MGEADLLADASSCWRSSRRSIAVGWILIFHQPHSTLFRGHVTNWSGDLGIDGFVNDMGGTC